MSDNQRRALCRIVFVLACALPTSVVAYWIGHPQTSESWELAIKAQLGVTAQIDSIETPGPNVTILRGLKLTDPELGTLLETVEARIEFGKIKNFIGIRYKVQGLTNASLACLVKQLNQNLIRSHAAVKPWRLEFLKDSVIRQDSSMLVSNVEPTAGRNSLAIAGLTIDVVPSIDGTTAKAYFKVPASDQPERTVVCEISKSDQQSQLIQLDTNQVSLPCWLVADAQQFLASVVSSLGQDSQFCGKLSYVPTPGQSELYVDGAFDRVDLKHSLRQIREPGQEFAIIELDNCLFVNGVPQQWNAVLRHESYAMKIHVEDLFISSWEKKVAPENAIKSTIRQQGPLPRHAIESTILKQGPRSAQADVLPYK